MSQSCPYRNTTSPCYIGGEGKEGRERMKEGKVCRAWPKMQWNVESGVIRWIDKIRWSDKGAALNFVQPIFPINKSARQSARICTC
jgi:hypothetical protein